MKLTFRKLTAEEIDCRISTVTENGVSLLLYKDARCDMNILDETVGPLRWERHHELINGNLFCTVSIYDEETGQWICKQDVGTESYTEKEKGQASDAFKRACFNVGIGRELYTAPFMWVRASDLKTLEPKGTGYTCHDVFRVTRIDYIGSKICFVEIVNEKTKKTHSFGTPAAEEKEIQRVEAETISETKATVLEKACKEANVNIDKLLLKYGVKSFAEMTEANFVKIMGQLEKANNGV